jgi:hypothetical protein
MIQGKAAMHLAKSDPRLHVHEELEASHRVGPAPVVVAEELVASS